MTDLVDFPGRIRRLLLAGRGLLIAHDGTPDLLERHRIAEDLAAQLGRPTPVRVRFDAFDPASWAPGDRLPAMPDARQWARLIRYPVSEPGRRLPPACGRLLSGADAARLRGKAMADGADPRPVLDLDAALAGGGIVSVDCGTQEGSRYFLWLGLACVEAAERAGRAPPVLMGKRSRVEPAAAALDWTYADADAVRLCYPKGDTAMTGRDHRDLARWFGAVSEREAVVVSDHADGIWTAEGEGRTVYAIRLGCAERYKPRDPDAERVFLAERRDGYLRCAELWVSRRLPDTEMDELARAGWHVGILAVTHDAAGSGPRAFEDAPRKLAQGMGMIPSLACLALHARLARDLGPAGLAFVTAIGTVRHPVALQAWAAAGPRPADRRQFVLAYPGLAALAFDPEVTRLVDARRPVLPHLCTILAAGPAPVRRFARHPSPPRWLHRYAWAEIGTILVTLGHGRLPAPGDYAWEGLWYCVGRVRNALIRHGTAWGSPATVAGLAVRLPGRDWTRRSAWLTRVPPEDFDGLSDFLVALRRWLARMGGGHVAQPARDALLAAYGTPSALLDASRRWHADPVLSAEAEGMAMDATWPVPFAPIDLGDGRSARPLASMRTLVAEGMRGPDADGIEGLAHCVASYGRACAEGASLIVSFRAGFPERRLSTLELRRDDEGTWRIGDARYAEAQHRGRRNAAPPSEALRMALTLRNSLLAGQIPVDASALEPRQTDARARTEFPAQALHPRWIPLLPPPFRELTAAALAEALVTPHPLDPYDIPDRAA